MHKSSYDKMARFKQQHLQALMGEKLTVLDLGSQDINGTYRPLFEEHGWEYLGVDMSPGKNVDLVLQDAYQWNEIANESIDIVISGQAFEHVEFFWLTMREIARVMKPGGLCCIIAPSTGPEHRYPVDCWRYYTDGLRALAKWGGLTVLSAETQTEHQGYDDGSDQWRDSMLIARKPNPSQP